MTFGTINKSVSLDNNLFQPILNNDPLPLTKAHKNLGIIVDDELNFKEHVKHLLKKSYNALRILFGNKHIFNFNLRKMLCESIVLSLFNYGNFTYGPCLDAVTRQRIQMVQNTCCRFVFGLRKFDRISKYLKILQWLPISKVWELHMLNFIHRIINTGKPEYLRSRISRRLSLHNVSIRERHQHTLHVPRHRTAFFQRSFSYTAAKLYNQVNPTLRALTSAAFRVKIREVYLTNFLNS